LLSQGLASLKTSPETLPQRSAVSVSGGISVKRLTLTDFRCYGHQRLELGYGPVVLTGPNGAGKTNLLEGLSFLVPGRGLRRARLSDLARRDSSCNSVARRSWGVAAVLRTLVGDVDVGTAYEAPTDGRRDKRIVKVNGETAKNQTVLAEYVSVLWLTPQMDRLFLEGPGARRRFLDRLVFDTDPAHAGRVSAYDHAQRERVRLLRNGNPDLDWLAVLEDTIVTRGVAVTAARLDVVRRLTRYLHGSGSVESFPGAEIKAVGEIEIWLSEGPALAAEDRFRTRLVAERGRDAAEGRSGTGPHRSDLAVRHLGNGQEVAFCSTGEQKAILVSLILATARMRAVEQGAAPLLLLDEIAAHLDTQRLDALFDEIIRLGAQVWMTGTDADLFRSLAGKAQFFTVSDSAVANYNI
jgi:DNA replication and repair protein RecF